MDPNENIKRQRELTDEIVAARVRFDEASEGESGDAEYDAARELAELASQLAELVIALDEWRRSGGFDPYGTHNRLVRSLQQELIQAARNIDPDNERLIEAGPPTETYTRLIEARRVLGLISALEAP